MVKINEINDKNQEFNSIEPLLERLKCCFGTYHFYHYVTNPKVLNCGGNACTQCIVNEIITRSYSKCKHCNRCHTINELKNARTSITVNILRNKLLADEIIKRVKNDTNNIINESKNYSKSVSYNLCYFFFIFSL